MAPHDSRVIIILMIKLLRKVVLAILVWVMLLIVLLTSSPETVFLPLIVLPFLLLLLALYLSVSFLMLMLFRDLSKPRRTAMAATASILPVFILVLSSVGQLTTRDGIIMLSLLAGLLFYIRRLDFVKKS